MKLVVLLGAPGSGKGTVAAMLAQAMPYRHLSTGDLLREAVKNDTPLGRVARGYMERGELVPDHLILDLVREVISNRNGDARYVLDGFPRTRAQADGLDRLVGELNGVLQGVVLLVVPREILIDRLSGRRVCRQCGAVYHVRNMPPKVEGRCDRCGGELYQRADDNEATVANRLDVYQRQTEELIEYYRQRGMLYEVDASGKPEATRDRIVRMLRAWG